MPLSSLSLRITERAVFVLKRIFSTPIERRAHLMLLYTAILKRRFIMHKEVFILMDFNHKI